MTTDPQPVHIVSEEGHRVVIERNVFQREELTATDRRYHALSHAVTLAGHQSLLRDEEARRIDNVLETAARFEAFLAGEVTP